MVVAGSGRIRSADDLIRPAVVTALGDLDDNPRDAAARRLADRYAAQIDDAAQIAADLAEVAAEDDDQARQIAALTRRVQAHAVLAELGPRLLAVLESLGATPKGRAQLGKAPAAAGSGKLAAMRAAR